MEPSREHQIKTKTAAMICLAARFEATSSKLRRHSRDTRIQVKYVIEPDKSLGWEWSRVGTGVDKHKLQ